MLKKVIFIASILFGVFILLAVGGILLLMHGQKDVLNAEITPISLQNLEDDTYTGEFKSFRWSNKVEVTIENHQIVEIKIIDDILLPQEEVSNEILEQVIEEQSLEVDGISGATVTYKAYLKAIENALKE